MYLYVTICRSMNYEKELQRLIKLPEEHLIHLKELALQKFRKAKEVGSPKIDTFVRLYELLEVAIISKRYSSKGRNYVSAN